MKSGNLNFLEPSGSLQACNGTDLPLLDHPTPCSRVLLEQLAVPQLVKKFREFYGTRSFTTAFSSARHLTLSWKRSFQSMPPNPVSWRSILILPSDLHLGLPSGFFPSGLPTRTRYAPHLSPVRAACSAHPSLLDLVRSTHHEAARYVFFFSISLFRLLYIFFNL